MKDKERKIRKKGKNNGRKEIFIEVLGDEVEEYKQKQLKIRRIYPKV